MNDVQLTDTLRLNFGQPSARDSVINSFSGRSVTHFAALVVAADAVKSLLADVAATAADVGAVAASDLAVLHFRQFSTFNILVDDVQSRRRGGVDGCFRASPAR